MAHKQTVRLIEIKSREGIALLPPFYLYSTELQVGENISVPTGPNTAEKTSGNDTGKEDAPMSDAQKRYLYRLLSDHGYEGETATQEIFKRLGVTSLKEVTKQDASALIDRLVEGVKA